MTDKQPVDLDHRIRLIDGYDLGTEGRTGSYVIADEKLTIIETSASPSVPYILDGLRKLNLDPRDVEYIIVTHIHLDHAGGAGLLLNDCPKAKVVVHPKGKRHLADPSRLIAGARAVYGDQFDDLFNPIVPIPEDRLIEMNDGDGLSIGENRTLTFYDSPGHANHHFSIYDPVSNGIFTGDTSGIYYHQVQEQVELYLPTTSPNQFDPDAMLHSNERFEGLNVDRIFFGHYGMSENPDEVFKQMKYWLPKFVDAGQKGMAEAGTETPEALVQSVTAQLNEMVFSYLTDKGVPDNHPVYDIMKLDFQVCAMGLVDYLSKKNR